MEHHFKEYIGKHVMIMTSDGRVIEGILKDGIRVVVNSYILLSSDYVYSVNMLDVWYKIYENGIMLMDENTKQTEAIEICSNKPFKLVLLLFLFLVLFFH